MGERAAVLKRVSTDLTRQEIANQDADVARVVADGGFTLARPAFELEASAYKGEHAPALDQILADVRAGRYTVVIAAMTSRFERRGWKVLMRWMLDLDAAGGRLIAADNPNFGDLSTPMGGMLTIMTGETDHAYSDAISKNVRRGFARMDKPEMRGNGYTGAAFRGMPPAGYVMDGPEHERYLLPDVGQPEIYTSAKAPRRRRRLAADIREAFDMAASGESTTAVGRKLGMTPDAVGKLLRNPVYGSGRYEIKRHDGVTVIHRCEPLVAPDVQALAVAGLEARLTGDHVRSRQLHKAMVEADPDKADFSNALWCGVCDVMRPTMQRYYGGGRPLADGTKAPKQRRYRCERKFGGCMRSVDADAADAEVNRRMSGSTRQWGRIVHIPGDDHASELQRVRDELDSLGARRLPRAEMLAETSRLYDELERLEALPRIAPRTVWKLGDLTIGERWASLDMAGRREWLLSDFRVRVKATGKRDGTVTVEVGYPVPLKLDIEHGHDLGDGLRGTAASGAVILWREDK